MLFEAELRTVLMHVAGVAAVGCGTLFLVDVVLSALARAGIATGAAESLRRVSPPLVRHGAELVVTALLALGAARPAGASTTPVRDWLRDSPTTTTVPTTVSTTTPTTAAVTTAAVTTATTTPRPVSPVPAPAPALAPATTRPAPTRASPPPAAARRPAPADSAARAGDRAATAHYVVRPGDCLWRIAARHLGPGATNQAIDSAWRAIYAANRAAVGDDPSLIHPGLVLTLPPLAAAH